MNRESEGDTNEDGAAQWNRDRKCSVTQNLQNKKKEQQNNKTRGFDQTGSNKHKDKLQTYANQLQTQTRNRK